MVWERLPVTQLTGLAGRPAGLCWRVFRGWCLGNIHTREDGADVVDSEEVMAAVLIERSTDIDVCGKGRTAGRAPEHRASGRAAPLLFLTFAPDGSETL